MKLKDTGQDYIDVAPHLVRKVTDSGAKDHQREDHEDRAWPFKDWHTKFLGPRFPACDLDFVEVNAKGEPVAVTELTRSEWETVNEVYRQRIIERYFERDGQGRIVKKIAEWLGVPAYIVLFPPSCSWLWVYSFQGETWREFSYEDYRSIAIRWRNTSRGAWVSW